MTHPDNLAGPSLTDQGIAALKSGDAPRARALLAEATHIAPNDERAWLWLSGAAQSDAERRACLERVLAINPHNAAALRGLQQLGAPPEPPPAATPQPQEPGPPAWTTAAPAQVPAASAPPIARPAVVPPPGAPSSGGPPARGTPRWLPLALAALGIVVLLGIVGGAALVIGRGGASASAPLATAAPADEAPTPTAAAEKQPLRISDSKAIIEFPDRVTFGVAATSKAGIERVVLEYGVDKLTCGSVIGRAFPTFKPGTRADVRWTWEMRQSGSEPPGAIIWYRWRITAKDGAEQVSADQRVTWIDSGHSWEQVSRDNVIIHWYRYPPAFGNDLLDTAVSALGRLSKTTGVSPDAPIHLYIYANNDDMREAVLYEPGWTGGQAYAANSVVIIGITEEQLEWGRRTVAHELTHVLVGQRTFACASDMPTWLNEGIAVYNEGEPEADAVAQLNAAIADNSLIPVRALGGGFSEHPRKADLSYSQSRSLVAFLLDTYGRDKLLALFDAVKSGTIVEEALNAVYGFGQDGLEERWRASVGAKPFRQSAAPTATPSPTPVPTYAPFDGTIATPPTSR